MKIAIQGLIIEKNSAGIGNYGYQLINSIIKYVENYDIELYLFIQKNIDIKYKNTIYLNTFDKNIIRIFYEQAILPMHFYKYDLIHYLDYSSSVINYKKPYIITIHDLTYYIMPDMFKLGSKLIKQIITPISVKRAAKIVTISENTKKDIMNYFDINEDKINVIYPGFVNYRKVNDSEKINNIKIKYGIKNKYILFVGTIEPRKNIKRLVEAFELVCKEINDLSLLIVGKYGWLYEDILKSIYDSEINNKIILTNYINKDELEVLYSGAELFIYPSLYEGFGIPPLEAMSCGVPVITSNISSLPEVVGDAAIFCDPYDINSIYSSIIKVLNDEKLRKELIERGEKRIRRFSWDLAAKQIINVYKNIL